LQAKWNVPALLFLSVRENGGLIPKIETSAISIRNQGVPLVTHPSGELFLHSSWGYPRWVVVDSFFAISSVWFGVVLASSSWGKFTVGHIPQEERDKLPRPLSFFSTDCVPPDPLKFRSLATPTRLS